MIERWRDARVLCIARANAPKAASAISAANKKVAVRRNVECSPDGGVGDSDRIHPGDTAIG
jgi:hypothetical protein